MAKIIAPNKSYNGTSASVPFVNGVGQTDDPHLIQWFKENGYEIEDEAVKEENSSPFDNMSVDELMGFATENGIDIGRATSKDTILKKIIEAGAKNGEPKE